MNTSYNYYQKVIDRFGVRRNTSITDDSNLSNNETTDDSKPSLFNLYLFYIFICINVSFSFLYRYFF